MASPSTGPTVGVSVAGVSAVGVSIAGGGLVGCGGTGVSAGAAPPQDSANSCTNPNKPDIISSQFRIDLTSTNASNTLLFLSQSVLRVNENPGKRPCSGPHFQDSFPYNAITARQPKQIQSTASVGFAKLPASRTKHDRLSPDQLVLGTP